MTSVPNTCRRTSAFYCLGGITLVCFLIQFATGFDDLLLQADGCEAYTSVQYLMTDVSFGC